MDGILMKKDREEEYVYEGRKPGQVSTSDHL